MGERFPLEDQLVALEHRLWDEGLGKTTDFDDVQAIIEDLLESLRSRTFLRNHREYGKHLASITDQARPDPFDFRKELFDITALAAAGGWTRPQIIDAVDETRVEIGISSTFNFSALDDLFKDAIRAGLAAGLSRPAILEVMDDLQCRVLECPEEFE